MNTTQTNIFQYQARQTRKQDKEKSAHDWQYKTDTQQANINQDIEERVSAMEEKSLQEDKEKHTITAQTRGVEQQKKDYATKQASDRSKVDGLVRQSNRRIFSISSTFPWSIFPNTIDIEESRVTFNFRQFLSYQSHSVDIKDITNVFIESGFFFATLQVVSRTFTQNDIKIEHLKKKQAVKARRIIEGMRTFVYNNIDTANYEIAELISKLEELHISDHVTHPNTAT